MSHQSNPGTGNKALTCTLPSAFLDAQTLSVNAGVISQGEQLTNNLTTTRVQSSELLLLLWR